MQESERRQRISSTPRLSPDEIATRSFSTSFRGFTESEVRAFLRRISDEVAAVRLREADLVNVVDDLEEQLRAPRPLDEQQLLDALGEETARLLRSAKEAADEIRGKAEERAARLIEEAQNEARQARADGEDEARRRNEESEAHAAAVVADAERRASELREETERFVDEQRAHAERERDGAIESARAEGRDMIEEAKALRERVLADLARRRNLVQAQVEELRTGRDHLLDAYRIVKRTFLEATDALAQVEARIPPRAARTGEVDLTVADDNSGEHAPIVEPEPPNADSPPPPDSPPGAGADVASGDRPALADVDSLFARIRAGQTEAAVVLDEAPADGSGPAAPAEPPAPEASTPAAEPAGSADVAEPTTPAVENAGAAAAAGQASAWRSRRAAELGGRAKPTVRASKRAAQDEQNALLDAVRRHKGRPTPADVLPDVDTQLDSWASVLRGALDAAYAAGRRAAGGPDAPASDDVARDAARQLVGPLRERVVGVLDDSDAGSDIATIAERIGARYREWKNEAVEGLVGDVLAVAWSRGVFDASADGTLLRWIAAEEGRCADCDDNALEPTVKGSAFPTGQPHPPAHDGCRCLLVPAAATP